MKKILLAAAAAALTLNVALWGQSITVTSPAAGANWCIGASCTVTWTKSGTMPDTVKIRLRRAGAPDSEDSVWRISDGTSNDGSFGPVTVPASVPAGDYYVRVRTDSPDVIGDSDTFHISTCPTATINVTSPATRTEWCIGNPCTVTWTKSGTMPDTVKIRLRRAGAPESEDSVWRISDGTSNDGSFGPVTVPASVPAGEYFVRVRTDSPDVIGNSPNFEVRNCSAGSSITVTAPDAASSWRPGSRQTISWTKTGALNPMANITLRREGAPESDPPAARIADGCANNGSRYWFISEDLDEGRYFVRVKSGGIQGDSAIFAINAGGRGSDLPGPDTPIRAELEMPGVGVEYYNGHIVAWVKNNGPDSVRNHDVKFRLNFPERGGSEQIITKRITVPVGAQEGVQLLAMAASDIPDAGLRTIVRIDTALSHIQDANRLNQHRDVRIYSQTRMPVDLAIAISNQRVSQVIGGGDLREGIPHHKYRLRATLHLRNNSSAPAEIARVLCRWQEQYRTDSGWVHYPETHAHGTLTLGSFRPGEDITRAIELEFRTYTFEMERRIHFELDPDRLLNDPNRGNNEVNSVTYNVR